MRQNGITRQYWLKSRSIPADGANAIAIDPETGAVIAGEGGSPDFPAAGSLAHSLEGAVSGFVVKISADFTPGFAFTPLFPRSLASP